MIFPFQAKRGSEAENQFVFQLSMISLCLADLSSKCANKIALEFDSKFHQLPIVSHNIDETQKFPYAQGYLHMSRTRRFNIKSRRKINYMMSLSYCELNRLLRAFTSNLAESSLNMNL
jgi:hypothetical protein